VMMTCLAVGLLARVSYELSRAENAAAQAVAAAPVAVPSAAGEVA